MYTTNYLCLGVCTFYTVNYPCIGPVYTFTLKTTRARAYALQVCTIQHQTTPNCTIQHHTTPNCTNLDHQTSSTLQVIVPPLSCPLDNPSMHNAPQPSLHNARPAALQCTIFPPKYLGNGIKALSCRINCTVG